MADDEVSISRDALKGLLTEKDTLSRCIEGILNQILEAQMTEHLQARPHERTQERQGYRNGSRVRTLTTRAGPLTLVVPQSRDGSFSTEIFRRYQRSEQAFVLALMEMYLQGVSTRKVKTITEELCGCAFSRATVSRLAAGLDIQVKAFASRRLDQACPFLMLDAMFLKVREDGQVVSRALLIAIGINEEGFREVLGLSLGDSKELHGVGRALEVPEGPGIDRRHLCHFRQPHGVGESRAKEPPRRHLAEVPGTPHAQRPGAYAAQGPGRSLRGLEAHLPGIGSSRNSRAP